MPQGPRYWRGLAAVLLVVGLFLVAYRAPLPFVRPLWNAAQDDWGSSWYVRHRMADRMLAQRTLIGKPRDAVVRMLGSGEVSSSEYYLEYCLGQERNWVGIDSEILVVEFDAGGLATNAYLRTD